MAQDQPDRPLEDEELNDFARDPFGQEPTGQRSFDDFHDDTFEEPDRDTDYPTGFSMEDEDMDNDYRSSPPQGRDEDNRPDDDFEQDDYVQDNFAQDNYTQDDEFADALSREQEEENPLTVSNEETDQEAGLEASQATDQWQMPQLSADEPDTWIDDDNYPDNDEDEGFLQRWPMGLLIVAVLAVVLLVAGGYGVIQQRTASEEEIRQLRAALATAEPDQNAQLLESENSALSEEVTSLENRLFSLQAENQKLLDMVAGLEAQLDAAIARPAAPEPLPEPEPQPEPAPIPEPVATKPAPEPPAAEEATAASATEPATQGQPQARPGAWFVNFGSYGQSSVAETWRDKLDVKYGDVITAGSEKGGKTLYRVRVINLADREAAESVARALEKEYKLPRLWVGKQ